MRWAARLLRPVSRRARRPVRLSVQPLEDRTVPHVDALTPVTPPAAADVKPDAGSTDGTDGTVKDVVLDGGPVQDGTFTGVGPIMYSMVSAEPKPPKPPAPYPQIGDRVWRDLNANGLQDAGEPGLAFVSLRLYQGDRLVGTTTTDGNGNYAFNAWNVTNGTADTSDDGLVAGTAYQIRIAGDQPALIGLRTTTTNAGTDELRDSDATAAAAGATLAFTMGPDEIYSHYDLGYAPAATIGNLVWLDANNNGVKDKGEVGLAGVTVRLLDITGKIEVATTTTGADGSYLFTGLLPGTYVVEIAKANFASGGALFGLASSTGTPGRPIGPYEGAATAPGDGKDHGTAFADGAVRSQPVTVMTGGLDNRAIDFGFVRSGGLAGRVFVDMNANGRIDLEDTTGVAGVKVTAAGPAGMFTATTDATGAYTFANLPAGTYAITETQPKGYASNTPNQTTAVVGPGSPATVNFGEARAVDLEVKVTARPAVVNVGGLITLTYRVKNVGTLAATGVTLLTSMPGGLKMTGIDQTGLTFDAAGQRASIGTLAVGAEAVQTVRVRADQVATYRLTATVQGTAVEDDMANNRSVAGVTVLPPMTTAPAPVQPMTAFWLASLLRR
jgi:uncharacterized repeat protein (TIGR01451 family)